MPYCHRALTECVWYGACPPDCYYLTPPKQSYDPFAILDEVLTEQNPVPVALTIEDPQSHFHPYQVLTYEEDYLLAQAIAEQDEGGFFFPLHFLANALNNLFNRYR